MTRSRFLVLATAAVAGLVFASSPALAHDLNAKVDTRTDPVRVDAWFDDDTPAEQAKVVVTDESGAEVASGTLNDKGVWTFPRPTRAGTYTVAVELAGHRTTVQFPIEESKPGLIPTGDEYTGWRLDKRLGLGAGLAVLLGGSLLFWYARRSRTRAGNEPLSDG